MGRRIGLRAELNALPDGHVAVPERAALASADNIDIVIRAADTHGAAPHTGSDAMLAAAGVMTTIQQALTRVADAREAGVISFGRLRGAQARNVLPAEVVLEGAMRTSDGAVRDRLAHMIDDVAQGIARANGVEIEARVTSMTPPRSTIRP